MPPLRPLVLLATLSLTACTTPTAPAPPEFSLSSEALRQQFPATRTLGVVELSAQKIVTSTDEKGRTTHLATGGAYLVKKTEPLIQAIAPSLLLTPDDVELRGTATVKKGDQLLQGDAETTLIRIDGVQLLPEGPHTFKKIGLAPSAPAEDKPVPTPEVAPVPVIAPPASRPEAVPAPAPEPKKPTPKKKKPAPKRPTAVPPPTPAPSIDPDRTRLQLMRPPSDA